MVTVFYDSQSIDKPSLPLDSNRSAIERHRKVASYEAPNLKLDYYRLLFAISLLLFSNADYQISH